MKSALLIMIIALGCLPGVTLKGNTTVTATHTTVTEITETPRRPGTGKMRRARYKIFSVNVGRYNGKIKTKYEKEMKALAYNAKSGKEKRADRKARRDILRTAQNAV